MLINRIYLQNYRVFEDALDLELPAGLVGIYGPNGAGKSTLIEAIRWTLFGKTRTDLKDVRTSGVNADCVTEIEFEHEGHQYVVRRVITGGGKTHTVKALAHCDGAQVADGPTDIRRYVHSVLGMDDAAFRASVFAEQKQLTAFSSEVPEKRKKLVMQLLGITPLDNARDLARADARARAAEHDKVRALLPNLDQLQVDLDDARARAEIVGRDAAEAATAAQTAAEKVDTAQTKVDALADVAREFDRLCEEGRSARAQVKEIAAQVDKLEHEKISLAEAAAALAGLDFDETRLAAAEEDLRRVDAVVAATAELESFPGITEPPPLDEEAASAAQQAATRLAQDVGELAGELKGMRAQLERARTELATSAALEGGGECPTCGQELGHRFEDVQAHRAAEVQRLAAEVARLEDAHGRASAAAAAAEKTAAAHTARLRSARASWQEFTTAAERRRDAEIRVARAVAALGRDVTPAEIDELRTEVARLRRAAREAPRLRGLLERLPVVEADLATQRERLVEAGGRLENLLDKVKALGFEPQQLEAARAELKRAREAAAVSQRDAEQAAIAATQAQARVEALVQRVADAEKQHADVADLADESRHLARLADLLHAFRNTVVATVGPQLARQAADLFAELTDNEYDSLKVNSENYELQITDHGRDYGMPRFSGSETDLANLALRIAIAEHVRFQSGGAVGLLVLDEVFGSLDDDRRSRMLATLERLRGRFRQVMVVTHANEVKEQLPVAIEVVKLRDRRSTARVIAGV